MRRRFVARAFKVYLCVGPAMIAVSLYTGNRASRRTGQSHYLLTRTTAWVTEEAPAENEADAAFDRAMREAGESPAIVVEKPCFVLGLLDATGPFVVVGGVILFGMQLVARRRERGKVEPTADSKNQDESNRSSP